MLPGGILSSPAQPAAFIAPRNSVLPRPELVDQHLGGNDINDASAGVQVQIWTADASDGTNVYLSAPSVVIPELVLTVMDGIAWVGLAFDQLMRPVIVYTKPDDSAWIYWFDGSADAFVSTELPVGSGIPFTCLDDTRALEGGSSDVVVAYVRSATLYYRQQRDRYDVEYSLTSVDPAKTFMQMGMNAGNRLQFLFEEPIGEVITVEAKFVGSPAWPPVMLANPGNIKPKIYMPLESTIIKGNAS